MAHRTKHRITAAARRQHRRSLGVVVDPSNRTRNPQGGYWCPGCGERHLSPEGRPVALPAAACSGGVR
ncbi:MAG: hypothetical protein U5N53_28355 [Mycobacterium sp.]|nr:hypothetical protein [Mycobacterium sp.]